MCYSSIRSLLSRFVRPFATIFMCYSSIWSLLSCSVHPFGTVLVVIHPFGLWYRVLFVHLQLFSYANHPFGLCCHVLFIHLELFSCVIRPFGLCCRVLFIHLELFSCAVRPFGLSYRVLSVHLRTIFVLCSSVFAGFSVVGCSSEARDLSTLDVRKFCCLVPHSLISLSLLSLFPFPLLLRGSSVLLDMMYIKKRSAT